MPNHVQQKLTIFGSKKDVEAFVVTARGAAPFTGDPIVDGQTGERQELYIKPLCFHLIAPLDDRYSKETYGRGPSIGFAEERNKWGVKWGAYDCSEPVISEDGTRATYSFTCAWSYPKLALERANQRYRSLQFFLSWGGEGPALGRLRVLHGRSMILHDLFGSDDFPEKPEGMDDDTYYDTIYEAQVNRYLTSHEQWVEDVLSAL